MKKYQIIYADQGGGLLYVQGNTDEVGDETESKIVIPKEKKRSQGVFNLGQ